MVLKRQGHIVGQNGYLCVIRFPVLFVLATDTYIQIKSTYYAIQKYQASSGTHWDAIGGATITTEADESVWREYMSIKVCWLALICTCQYLYQNIVKSSYETILKQWLVAL